MNSAFIFFHSAQCAYQQYDSMDNNVPTRSMKSGAIGKFL
ncbi:hypothetical protein SXCC_02265 [Gluconacetobacter sp. SXCC-1]|nr:hypothetical protein SXCC_02265 [Gluconacetobacter sp. SXCC-1]